jgi:CRP-like cAMP-binding protein
MLDKYLMVISRAKLFEGINRQDLISILECLKPVITGYKRNEYISLAGEETERVGLVLEGEAAVFKDNAAGHRLLLNTIKPGQLFGEMIVFSDHNRWPASVQAQENCKVLFLTRAGIIGECEQMCPWHRQVILNMLKITSERALLLSRKVEYLTIKSMRGKICSYLFEMYIQQKSLELTLPLNRNEMASFLNVSRPSMSREMAKMKEEGIIEFDKTKVRIIDLEALKLNI